MDPFSRTDGTHTLTGWPSNNTNGVGFKVHFGEVLVSGISRMSRIAVSGIPGEKVCTVDRFYIDLPFRSDKSRRHGAAAMSLLCSMYRAGNTSFLKVVTATPGGKRFYLRCGFVEDAMGDLIMDLQRT